MKNAISIVLGLLIIGLFFYVKKIEKDILSKISSSQPTIELTARLNYNEIQIEDLKQSDEDIHIKSNFFWREKEYDIFRVERK